MRQKTLHRWYFIKNHTDSAKVELKMEIKVEIPTYSQKMAQARMTSEDGLTETKIQEKRRSFFQMKMKSRLDSPAF